VGEQCRLLPAHPGANLHDDVFSVVGVFGQKQDLQFPFQTGQVLQCGLILLLRQFLHLRVGHQFQRLFPGIQRPAVGPEGLHQRLKFRLFPVEPGHQFRVAVGLGRPQPGFDLRIFCLNGVEFI